MPFLALLAANLGLDRYFTYQRDEVLSVVDGRLNPARLALADLLAALIDQETGERGYIITGQEAFLEPYLAGGVAADARLDELQRLLAPEPDLLAGIQRLRSRVTAWRQLGATFEIEAKRAGRDGEATALVATRTGMALFDAARAELTDAQQAVRAELEAHDARLEQVRRRLSFVRLATVVAGVAIILVSRRLLARWITEPVEGLGRAVRVVAGGELECAIPASGPPDVAELGRDVEAMRKRLLAEVERARTAQAALAQRGMVVLGLRNELAPGRLDLHDGVRIAAGFQPAEGVVAGDWYDVVPLSPERLAIALVDVSGHGAGAGVFALKTKHLMLAALRNGMGPAEALGWLAAQLGDTGDQFLTGVVLELDLAAGRLRYASAGHPPVLVQVETVLSELAPTGPLLGPLPGSWGEASIPFEAGAVLAVYSDGLVEARDAGGEEFGAERLRSLLASPSPPRHPDPCDPDALVHACMRALERHGAGRDHDDITLVVAARSSGRHDDVGRAQDVARQLEPQSSRGDEVDGQAKAAWVLDGDR